LKLLVGLFALMVAIGLATLWLAELAGQPVAVIEQPCPWQTCGSARRSRPQRRRG